MKRAQIISLISAALSVALPVAKAGAQAGDTVSAINEVADVPEVDVSVPKSPAFTVLGISPQNATNPATVTELGASLLNVVDKNGDLQTGVAFETNPYLLFKGASVSLGDYQNNYATRLLTNTQFSFATAKATENSNESMQIALGLHVTPWTEEAHDPRRNKKYLNCLEEVFRAVPKPNNRDIPRPEDDGPAVNRRVDDEKLLREALGEKRCKTNYAEAFNNPSAWTLGVTPTAISKSGSLDDLDWAGLAVWSTLGLRLDTKPLGVESQFILHGRVRLDEVVADTAVAGTFVEQDTGVVAARFRTGSTIWNMSAEAAYFYTDRDKGSDDSYSQVTGGFEFRMTDGVWLEAEAGRTLGKSGDDDTFGNISVKWNLGAQ